MREGGREGADCAVVMAVSQRSGHSTPASQLRLPVPPVPHMCRRRNLCRTIIVVPYRNGGGWSCSTLKRSRASTGPSTRRTTCRCTSAMTCSRLVGVWFGAGAGGTHQYLAQWDRGPGGMGGTKTRACLAQCCNAHSAPLTGGQAACASCRAFPVTAPSTHPCPPVLLSPWPPGSRPPCLLPVPVPHTSQAITTQLALGCLMAAETDKGEAVDTEATGLARARSYSVMDARWEPWSGGGGLGGWGRGLYIPAQTKRRGAWGRSMGTCHQQHNEACVCMWRGAAVRGKLGSCQVAFVVSGRCRSRALGTMQPSAHAHVYGCRCHLQVRGDQRHGRRGLRLLRRHRAAGRREEPATHQGRQPLATCATCMSWAPPG